MADQVALRRGPYRSGIRRREEIVTEAISVFGQQGFAGATVRAIADRVGVSHATLLQHFGSKEGLLTAVLREWDRRALAANLADVAGLDYIRRIPDVMATHLQDRGLLELFTTMAAEGANPRHPAHGFIVQRYEFTVASLRHHIQLAKDAGDIVGLEPSDLDREARMLTAVLDGVGLQWLIEPETDLVGISRAYVERAIACWTSEA